MPPPQPAAYPDVTPQPIGRVTLVGAGPGDPGLLTVAGLDALRAADVLIYDALANPVLLNEAPPHCQRIDAGKRAKHHRLTQDQTNAVLVEHAQCGAHVVRLKGGDPYLFGRGAEEASYCASHGVPCTVVPGITSGVAAPAYAGIPVTHRHVASTVTLITGHEDPTKPETSVDYDALAGLVNAGGTLCFYMGVGRLPLIANDLITRGVDAQTPAAVVQWGTLPTQRHAAASLAEIAETIEKHGIGAPAIVVVGPAVGLDHPGLDWFTTRPLFGRRVLVTRTRQQASELRRLLEAQGAEVVEAPTIKVVPPADPDAVRRAVADIASFDWLVLTSANAVDALATTLADLGLDARALAGVRLAAIGAATVDALRAIGLRADCVPDRAISDALAVALLAQAEPGSRCLLLRADIARPGLPKRLADAGHDVTEAAAYETQVVDALPAGVAEDLAAGRFDWVTFTSASTARNLATLLGDNSDALARTSRASVGPITSKALAALGYPASVESPAADMPTLVEAIVQAVTDG